MGASAVPYLMPGATLLTGAGNAAANMAASENSLQATRETNQQNYKIYQESKDFAREQSDTQWEREKEMFALENNYNNPVEVVKRLRDAGINPALAMQGSLGSAMSSAGSGGSPALGNNPTPPSMQVPQNAQYLANMATGLSDSFLKSSMMLKNLAEAKKIGVDTTFAERAMEDNLKAISADAKYKEIYSDLYQQYEPQRLSKELVKLDKENRKLDQEVDLLVREGNYKDAQTKLENLLASKQIYENNYLSSYYERKKLYLDRFVKAELDQAENNAKAIIMNALSNQTSAKAAYNSSLAALKNADTQEYLAHNPNDLGGLLANVIKGYAGSPEQFGKLIKDEGILGVIYKMTKGERDKTFQTLADEIQIPYRYLKRFIRDEDPLGGFLDFLKADGEEFKGDFGFKFPGNYLIDYIHDRYSHFRDDHDDDK